MFAFFFCKQKTAYEMRISDCSSHVCSSDLRACYTATLNPGRKAGHTERRDKMMEPAGGPVIAPDKRPFDVDPVKGRPEEHTSELQSLMRISYAVFCLQQRRHSKLTRQATPPTVSYHFSTHCLNHRSCTLSEHSSTRHYTTQRIIQPR